MSPSQYLVFFILNFTRFNPVTNFYWTTLFTDIKTSRIKLPDNNLRIIKFILKHVTIESNSLLENLYKMKVYEVQFYRNN